jgi:hypothetical protein
MFKIIGKYGSVRFSSKSGVYVLTPMYCPVKMLTESQWVVNEEAQK